MNSSRLGTAPRQARDTVELFHRQQLGKDRMCRLPGLDRWKKKEEVMLQRWWCSVSPSKWEEKRRYGKWELKEMCGGAVTVAGDPQGKQVVMEKPQVLSCKSHLMMKQCEKNHCLKWVGISNRKQRLCQIYGIKIKRLVPLIKHKNQLVELNYMSVCSSQCAARSVSADVLITQGGEQSSD